METSKEIISYKKQTSAIIIQAEHFEIKTEDNLKSAVDYLSEIKLIAKKIQEEKEKLSKPAMEVLKNVRNLFNPFEKNTREAEMIIKGKILDFNTLQEKRASAKIEKLEQDVASGKTDIVKASEKMEALVPASQVETSSGKIQYRTIKKITIYNLSKLPRKYLLPNTSLIRSDILKGVKIPGAEIKEEKIVAGL